MANRTPSQGPFYTVPSVHGSETYICRDSHKGRIELACVYSQAEYEASLPMEENAELFAAAPQMAVLLRDAYTAICEGLTNRNVNVEMLKRDIFRLLPKVGIR